MRTLTNRRTDRRRGRGPTPGGLIRAAGLAAIAGGLLFVTIQPLHPADVLSSVSTDAWAITHFATLLMELLFLAGITGIYARQVQELGWLGLTGYVVLSIGLLMTAAGAVIEVLVAPLLVSSQPDFVVGFLGLVEGKPTGVDLGAIPTVWTLSSVGFLGGTLLFGVAVFRAGILSRWASAIFAVGMYAAAPLVPVLGTARIAAVPIGLGLAWMGWSLVSERRHPAPAAVSEVATSRAEVVAAA